MVEILIQELIERRKVFQEFERAFCELERTAEAYQKIAFKDFKEIENMGKFLSYVNDQWKILSQQLHSAESGVREVVIHWERYQNGKSPLMDWMFRAERVVNLTEDEKLVSLRRSLNFIIKTF